MSDTLSHIIGTATSVIVLATPMALVLVYFFWNLFQLLLTVADAEKKKQARARLIWSVFALFVLFTLSGLVAVLQQSLFGQTAGTSGGGTAPITAPRTAPVTAPTPSTPSTPSPSTGGDCRNGFSCSLSGGHCDQATGQCVH